MSHWTKPYIKYKSIWIYFIREYWTWLKLRWIASNLSHNSRVRALSKKKIHWRVDEPITVLDVATIITQYLALIEERTNSCYFFKL